MGITRDWAVTDMDDVEKSSCKIVRGNEIMIPTGGFCTVKKGVYFTHPKLKQGAFRDWAENPIPPEWDRAWYECCFTSTYPEGKACCEAFGEPILTRRIEIFRESHVEQNEAYKDLSFDYSIKVWANCEDRIELQVRNYTSKGWDIHGLQNYTERDLYTNTTLTWPAVNLTLDNFDPEGHGLYKFVGNISKSQPYSGPTIKEKFYELRVTPTQGTNTDTFNYSVTVNANISDKIMLQVKNHTTNRWDSKGTRDYTASNINITLTWHNIQLNTHELNRRNDSMFRFVPGYVKSEIYTGPKIIEEEF